MMSGGTATRIGRLSLFAVFCWLCFPSSAGARNPIRQSFFNAYPSAVGSRLDNLPSLQGHCGVCHYDFTGGGPRNLFGQRVEAVLPDFPNNDAGRQQAFHSIENEDSDGDGFTQLIEVTDTVNYTNTPTFPGLTSDNVGQVSNIDLSDILAYLTPETESDTEAPIVTLTSPNGGEGLEGGSAETISWTATDNVAVTGVDLYYRDHESASWKMLARSLDNTGTFTWHVHNTPTGEARVKVVARDAIGNENDDESDAVFSILAEPGGTVPTTLRDFHQPGSQPFDAGAIEDRSACVSCHGGYDPNVEPGFVGEGSMMAQAMRDPVFLANLAVAEQDATSSGDLCLRCHTPIGWLNGRSNPTDGTELITVDRDGVTCDFCHRMTDPIYVEGVSPPEDLAVLDALEEIPTGYSNGMYVSDPNLRRRGPFADAVAPHPFLESPFHRRSEFCGTCHDVSNPVFERAGENDYVAAPLDAAPDSVASDVLLPVERTYSEWLMSAFPDGVYAPEFAGNKPDGIVSTCQDCHMRDVEGKGCNDANAPLRSNLPLHDQTGGNYWVPTILEQLFPGEVDPAAMAAGAARAVSMLEKAADLTVTLEEVVGAMRAEVTVTNKTGHKLPTGYPEGRRIWLHVVAYDEGGQPIEESGAYDSETGVLTHDEKLRLYNVEPGLSPELATALGLEAGPSFHFVLNDTLYKDNRIPPEGFTNAGYGTFGGAPVDPEHEGPDPRYADGQNWDVTTYDFPTETRSVIATLYYQTTSREFVEFMRDENVTNDAGQVLYDLWTANGRAAPVAMVADTATATPSSAVDSPIWRELRVRSVGNPATGDLEFRIELPYPDRVLTEIFDVTGRRIRTVEFEKGADGIDLAWDGRDEASRRVGAGVYWLRVTACRRVVTQQIVRLR